MTRPGGGEVVDGTSLAVVEVVRPYVGAAACEGLPAAAGHSPGAVAWVGGGCSHPLAGPDGGCRVLAVVEEDRAGLATNSISFL